MTLALIGGSGLYSIPELELVAEHTVDTPYGAPSSTVTEMRYGEHRLFFLPRHGKHHEIPPHQINYRANVCALKKLGASQIVSISAVGSMRGDIRPGDVVVVDQYLDFTKRRASTFFEDGIVAHVAFAEPVCAALARAAGDAAEAAGARVHRAGTYLCMEGPQFSTRAESRLYKSWGVDVIGMTAMPEAKLAREAELPYATLAFSTDYDAWHETEAAVSVDAVLAVLRANVSLAARIVLELPARVPDPRTSPASRALEHAVLSHVDRVPPAVRARLSWLLPDRPIGP